MRRKPRLLDLCRQALPGAVRALQQVPEQTVTGAVMEHVAVLDRCPLRGLRGLQDVDGFVDLRDAGREASMIGWIWFGWMLHIRV